MRGLSSWAPVAVWAAAGALPMTVALAAGHDPLAATTWMRGDSKHYLSIAGDGYDLYPCEPGSSVMCGDAGWFAAYSWLVGAIARLGVDAAPAGVAVAWLLSLATLILLWHTFLRSLPFAHRVALVVVAAFVPGQIYHRALFPLSMLAFFALLHLWLLWRRRYVGAGLAAAVAAASYPLGVLLLPVAAAFAALRDRRATVAERVRCAAVVGGLGVLGPLAVVTAMKIQTGSWDAYFLIQEKYGHGLHLPFDVLRSAVDPLLHGPLLDLDDVPALQTALVATAVTLVVAWCVARRREMTDADWLLAAVTVVTWALPLTQVNVSLYRSEAALVPAVVLLRRLPRPAAVAVAAGAVLISIPMAWLFFERRLV